MEEEIVVGGSSMADEQSDAGDENERCGICMEFVIDRGVLDCCSHWFCFKCIDNWAIITNLCPLCKSQFQLITCLPVYDTLGSTDVQRHSSVLGETEREESWCIYGKNNALSFPSYYIDEDAVVCLEGDGCRVRSGVTTAEEEQSSTLDTSVACDSCDIWYHAICVGFDPNGTIEVSWLCPRCETSVLKDSNSTSFQISTPKSPKKDILTRDAYEDTLLKSKVYVSVADAGETAVVVSMVESESHGLTTQDRLGVAVPGKQDEDGASAPVCNSLDASDSMKFEGVEPLKELPDTVVNLGISKGSTIPPAMNDSKSVLVQESSQIPHVLYNKANHADTLLESNTTCSVVQSADTAMPVSLVEDYGICDSMSQNDNLGKSAIAKLGREEKTMLAVFDNALNSRSQEKLQDEPGGKLSSDSQDVDLSIHLDGTIHSSSSADKPAMKNGNVEEGVPVGDTTKTSNHLLGGPKRKQGWKDGDALNKRDPMQCHQWLGQTAKESEYPIKRARLSGQNEQICLLSSNAHNDNNEGTVSKDICGLKKKLKVERLQTPKKEHISHDLINLVKGPDFRASERIITDKTANENDQVSVVRMRKIMRRRLDENETTRLVQELTKELRAMDGFGRSDDLGKIDASNEIFLAAFRAAMNRAHEKENINKSKVSHLGVNQQLLKKGRIRENLTKKLYGTGNGKRRRAWDRDWEIEFWKDRCNKTKQPKKVDTPNTIRELLYRSLDTWSKSSETELGSEAQDADSIFSRLYVADTSLFPRKNDIRPLSACKESASLQAHEHTAEAEKVKDLKAEESSVHDLLKPNRANDESKGDSARKLSVSSGAKTTKEAPHSMSEHGSMVNTTGNKCKIPRSNIETTAGSVLQIKGPMGVQSSSSILNSAVLRSTITDEKSCNSGDVKSDKRKWALEVLARKTGGMPSGANQKKMEASLGEKGNFPLLIQLPSDMRPILPHDRRSKVPTSVRQMQLNRLVEHFLKKANLQTIRRTAESEFAVADAVIKEREIYERSNSKSVYTNLCAQALSQKVHSHKVTEKREDSHDSGNELNDEVTEALKAAGLISDSPHESPYHISENSDSEADLLVENKADLTNSVDNVLDLDCHPALDIYGDFEYDLDDLDIPGSSSLLYSSIIPAIKSDNAASKVKVVLSMGHCNMHAADQNFHGENNENLSTKQTDVKALIGRGECVPDLKPMFLPGVGDVHAPSGIENSATLDMPMDKNMSSLCSLQVEKDIEPTVQSLKVDPEQGSQEDLGSSLNGLYTNSIDGNPSSGQDQSFGDNHKLNQMERPIVSSSCPVKHRTSTSELINDQVDEVVNNSSSVKLPYVDSEVDNQRKASPPHIDATISQPDQQNYTTEIDVKCPVPIQSERDDASRKESELGRNNQRLNIGHSICKKVEAYVKEHLRPLCKSGVVTVEQYRWAVGKTVDKVMKYHCNAKNADFLITEGNKVKKLAEQYLQAFKQKEIH